MRYIKKTQTISAQTIITHFSINYKRSKFEILNKVIDNKIDIC